MKKPISARIDEETLKYIQKTAGNVNGLINDLLANWMNEKIAKQMTLWKEETGTDKLSQMKNENDIKCSQCCRNCIYFCKDNREEDKGTGCKMVPLYDRVDINKFVCIYWVHKKKGSR